MFHHHGGALYPDEARKALGPYGPLSKCEPLDGQMQDVLGLGPSVLIEFTTFDPNRDIQAVSTPSPLPSPAFILCRWLTNVKHRRFDTICPTES